VKKNNKWKKIILRSIRKNNRGRNRRNNIIIKYWIAFRISYGWITWWWYLNKIVKIRIGAIKYENIVFVNWNYTR